MTTHQIRGRLSLRWRSCAEFCPILPQKPLPSWRCLSEYGPECPWGTPECCRCGPLSTWPYQSSDLQSSFHNTFGQQFPHRTCSSGSLNRRSTCNKIKILNVYYSLKRKAAIRRLTRNHSSVAPVCMTWRSRSTGIAQHGTQGFLEPPVSSLVEGIPQRMANSLIPPPYSKRVNCLERVEINPVRPSARRTNWIINGQIRSLTHFTNVCQIFVWF